MKKLNITKERFEKSRYFTKKYGNLAFVSESGKTYKTDKGEVIRFVNEAREYVDDDSIEEDSAEEFIIFEDPNIFQQIANVQKKQEKKVEREIEKKDVTKQDVEKEVQQVVQYNGPGIGTQIASTAIAGAGNIITNPTILSIAAGAYGVNKAADTVTELIDGYENLQRVQKSNAASQKLLQKHIDKFAAQGINVNLIKKGYDYMDNMSDEALDAYGESPIHNMDFHKMVAKSLPEKQRSEYLSSAQNLCDKYGGTVATGAATAAGAGAGATAAGAGGAGAASTGTTIFGTSLATIGWIAAGVAAAAIITPYIYDKVRACTKTWLADIIAEIKFRADGKNYRCFYDLDENKWILTYANVKWTSYMDNKLDKETTEEFFNS